MVKLFHSSAFKNIIYPVIVLIVAAIVIYYVTDYKNNAVDDVRQDITDSLQNENFKIINHKINQVDSMACYRNENVNKRIDVYHDNVARQTKILNEINNRITNMNKTLEFVFENTNDLKKFKDFFFEPRYIPDTSSIFCNE